MHKTTDMCSLPSTIYSCFYSIQTPTARVIK